MKDNISKVIVYIRFIIRYVVYKISQIFTTLFECNAFYPFYYENKIIEITGTTNVGGAFYSTIIFKI